MWVFCCGMRRGGSTLQYQLTAGIVESLGVGTGLGWVEHGEFAQLQADRVAREEFLVVKCHRYVQEATELFSSQNAKAVYVYRDLRDVVVSTMNKWKRSFWEVTASGLLEEVLEEYYQWNRVSDILVRQYEMMVADLRSEVFAIGNHLGVGISERVAHELSDTYSVKEQVRRIERFDYNREGVGDGQTLHDPISLLHRNHVYSGKSEQWRTALSPLQVGLVEYVAHQWLTDRGYALSQGRATRKAAALFHVMYGAWSAAARWGARYANGFIRR